MFFRRKKDKSEKPIVVNSISIDDLAKAFEIALDNHANKVKENESNRYQDEISALADDMNIKSNNDKIFVLKLLMKLPFKKDTQIRGDFAINGIFATIISVIFWAISLLLLVFSFGSLALTGYTLYKRGLDVIIIFSCIGYLVLGMCMYLLSGMFRLASIEVSNIDNKVELLGIFSAIISVFSLVLAIVALKY